MDRELDAAMDRMFGAAETNDWDTFRVGFTDEATLRQNIGSSQTIDEAMTALPLITADGTSLRYENIRRFYADHAVTEIHDAVFTKPDGRVVRIDVCLVLEFDEDAKVIHAHEYLDSAAAAALAE